MSQVQDKTSFIGKITYTIFHNPDNFYHVVRIQVQDEQDSNIIATGYFDDLEEDVLYRFFGSYVEHPRYGMQFIISSYEKLLPNEEEGIIRYLSGVQFPGIGKKTAMNIVKYLGEDCLNLIKSDPDCLYTIPGLSKEKADIIYEGVKKEDDGLAELVRFLNIHGIGMRNLVRLNRAYGKKALEVIQNNPYRVIEDCDGFGFKTADNIALALGFSRSDERRLYALLINLCMDLCVRAGDSWVDYDVLKERFVLEVEGIEYDYDSIFHNTLINQRLVQEDNRVYPITQYEAEIGVASFLYNFPYSLNDPVDNKLLNIYLEQMQKDLHINYDEDQVRAINEFFDKPFTILTGGPGTGKTTVVRAMVELYRMLYPNSTIVCAAPTGRAAKRLSELTNTATQTIHSLLKWDLETNTFGKSEDDPILCDLLIVDEFSMVDLWLFYKLCLASKKVKKICIIGDEDQLPSVSPGCVLRDLITSNKFPLVRLNNIYRQKEGSDVISLAHDVRNGSVDFDNYVNDIAFLEDEYDVKNNIIKIVDNALSKGYRLDEVQVLSPMYNGNAGINVLNNALQDYFNPKSRDKKELKVGYLTFRENDKILQLKNQPDDDVYNGDIGILEEIYYAEESETKRPVIIVNFDGIYVEYNPDNFSNITLAYCISVHKSQGSEYPIVIVPITRQHSIMLQKNLIYTAITRAKQSLILIGNKEAFKKGITIVERHRRNTTLVNRINDIFA